MLIEQNSRYAYIDSFSFLWLINQLGHRINERLYNFRGVIHSACLLLQLLILSQDWTFQSVQVALQFTREFLSFRMVKTWEQSTEKLQVLCLVLTVVIPFAFWRPVCIGVRRKGRNKWSLCCIGVELWHLCENYILLCALTRNNLAVGMTTALDLLGAYLDAFVRCANVLVVLAWLWSELLFQVFHALFLHSRKILVLLLGAFHVPLPSLRLKGRRSFELWHVFSLRHHGKVSSFRLTHRVCCARPVVQGC